MKQELAAFEIMKLLDELEFLKDAKLEKIYNLENGILLIFHVRNKGKQILRIENKFLYLASEKEAMPEKPSNFCIVLRKHLEGSKLKKIEQRDFERIVEFVFETKHGIHRLIIELFGKGNVVLCDENYMIIIPLHIEKWERCEIRPKQRYEFPKQRFDFLNLSEGALKKMLELSKYDSLVKSLAIDLGLGGVYAEELCLISCIDKKSNPKKLGDIEIKELYNSIIKLKKVEKKPMIVYENNEIIDIVPIDLEYYKNKKKKIFESYNVALDSILSKEIVGAKEKIIESRINKEIEKINKIIDMQQKNLEEIEKDMKEKQEIANAIYQNYELVSEILREIKKAREKYSWEEIKRRLKGHKIIKEIDEKTGNLIIEI